jgi:hypothetical protein
MPSQPKPMASRTIANCMIYLSVIAGLALVIQLLGLVPSWLFFTILGGWAAYLFVAVMAGIGRRIAYPLALVLSILTLAASLPQPEHYSLVSAGLTPASLTFITGTVLQFLVIITVSRVLLLDRRQSLRRKLV